MENEQANTKELIQKLVAAQEEMKHSGPIHRRDLSRYIQRLKREILKAQFHSNKA